MQGERAHLDRVAELKQQLAAQQEKLAAERDVARVEAVRASHVT